MTYFVRFIVQDMENNWKIIKYVRLKYILNIAMPQGTSKGCVVLPVLGRIRCFRGCLGLPPRCLQGSRFDTSLGCLFQCLASLVVKFFSWSIGICHIAVCPQRFSYLLWLLPRRPWLYLLCLCPALRQLKSTVRFYFVSSKADQPHFSAFHCTSCQRI